MSILRDYCNQTIPHKIRSATVNEYNEYTYTDSTINCRVTFKRQLFRRNTGEQLLSNAIIHTETAVQEGDKLTLGGVDWHVELVYPWIDLDGNTFGYKCVL